MLDANGNNTDPLAPKGLDKAFKFAQQYRTTQMEKVHKTKTIEGEQHAQPNAFCRICLKMLESTGIVGDTELKAKNCPDCQKELDNGYTAFSAPDGRYCFIKSVALLGRPNHQKITNAEMDLLQQRIKEQNDKSNGSN